MANETKRVFHATTVTLEASGATVTNTNVVKADDNALNLATYGDYANARFVLNLTFSSAPGDNAVVDLIAQSINIDGSNSEPDPTGGLTGYTPRVVDSFVCRGTTSAQSVELYGYDLPREAYYWLRDSAGVTIASGWSMKAQPFTFAPT